MAGRPSPAGGSASLLVVVLTSVVAGVLWLDAAGGADVADAARCAAPGGVRAGGLLQAAVLAAPAAVIVLTGPGMRTGHRLTDHCWRLPCETEDPRLAAGTQESLACAARSYPHRSFARMTSPAGGIHEREASASSALVSSAETGAAPCWRKSSNSVTKASGTSNGIRCPAR